MVDPEIKASLDKLTRVARWYVESADSFEVDSVSDSLGITFPMTYQEFLLSAGHGFMPLEGSAYCIDDDLTGMQKRARAVARRNGISLPSDAFVFLEHQGFAYNFFLLIDGDDPPVYELVDGTPELERVSPALSQWISGIVDSFLSRK